MNAPDSPWHTLNGRYRVSAAEGTVASSSKINEPFRRPWDVERAFRKRCIPLLMTDGRAITGMTADSCERARTLARIFPHFSPQEFQFLRIRGEPVSEIELAELSRSASHLASEREDAPEIPVSEIFNLPRHDLLFPRPFTGRSTFFTSVWLLTPFRLVFLTTAGCLPVPSVSYPSSISFPLFPSFPTFCPSAASPDVGGSSPDTARLGIRICIGKSSPPVIRPSRISIFRWTECLRYIGRQDVRGSRRCGVVPGRLLCSCSRCKLPRSRAIARSHRLSHP